MCVITLVETVRPSDGQVGQMWDANPRGGGGVAYRGVENGRNVVRWQKGLDREAMIKLNQSLPMPYILHFRQPSHDTSDSILATHPFCVDDQATSELEGITEGWVLFHNGFWAEWRRKTEALCLASGGRIKGPSGAWSDTRALALAANHMGLMFLEMVNEKVLCLGPNAGEVEMFGGPWLSVKAEGAEKTFVVSNRTWETTTRVTDHRRHAQESTTKLLNAAQDAVTGKAGGTSQPTPFPCSIDRAEGTVGSRDAQQESVQEARQGPVQRSQETSGSPLAHWDGKRACYKCTKRTSAGQLVMRQWYCFQCWSDAIEKNPELLKDRPSVEDILNEALWVGTCERCRVGSSGMKTVSGNSWLCHACWETNGKPNIYYAREHQKSA